MKDSNNYYTIKTKCACCNKEKSFDMRSDQWYEVPICDECNKRIYELKDESVKREMTYDIF